MGHDVEGHNNKDETNQEIYLKLLFLNTMISIHFDNSPYRSIIDGKNFINETYNHLTGIKPIIWRDYEIFIKCYSVMFSDDYCKVIYT